jgi:hypothetical protein
VNVSTNRAAPARFRLSLTDDASGAMSLDLPPRRMWPAALICGAFFAVFAYIGWTTMDRIAIDEVHSVFDLTFVLFESFWLLGWSVAVAILGLLTILLVFYRETARLQNGQLVLVPRLGPLRIISAYDLAGVANVRVENAGGPARNVVRVRFDYEGAGHILGDVMPRGDAERLVATIQSAGGAAAAPPTPVLSRLLQPDPIQFDRPGHTAAKRSSSTLPLSSPSALALIAANLVPLVGVLFFGWDVASVIVVFWAESAIIGFYTAAKMAIVGKVAAIFAVPFFVGHFGGFMAGHFLFIYAFFIRGPGVSGAEPDVRAALAAIFVPLWPSLVGLFISHGVSFYDNFLEKREYAGATMKRLMLAPYNRIVIMQVTVILGGWVVLLLESPVPALALLIVLKTAVDLSAHRTEHAESP